MPDAGYLTIGKVVKRLQSLYPDLTISKVRYLEDEGLLNPSRTPGGYRLYSQRDIKRLETILYLQKNRFLPLSVIKDTDPGNEGFSVVWDEKHAGGHAPRQCTIGTPTAECCRFYARAERHGPQKEGSLVRASTRSVRLLDRGSSWRVSLTATRERNASADLLRASQQHRIPCASKRLSRLWLRRRRLDSTLARDRLPAGAHRRRCAGRILPSRKVPLGAHTRCRIGNRQ